MNPTLKTPYFTQGGSFISSIFLTLIKRSSPLIKLPLYRQNNPFERLKKPCMKLHLLKAEASPRMKTETAG